MTPLSTPREERTFLSLFQHLAINLEQPGYTGIDKFPVIYDVCCPTVIDAKICNEYFPSAAIHEVHIIVIGCRIGLIRMRDEMTSVTIYSSVGKQS